MVCNHGQKTVSKEMTLAKKKEKKKDDWCYVGDKDD